jgi:hypothetical protein
MTHSHAGARPRTERRSHRTARLALGALLAALIAFVGGVGAQSDPYRASTLLDISGIAWIEDDVFVVVHDGKDSDDERSLPRVSLVLLPADVAAPAPFARAAADGMVVMNLSVAWPSGVPNDLESIARIPGTRQLLLVESGDNCSPYQRIFVVTLDAGYHMSVDEVAAWPDDPSTPCVGVFNVEASAVFAADDGLYFVYAERAEGAAFTDLRWAPITLGPLAFGAFTSVSFAAAVSGEGVRPIVALDVDFEGHVYAATAYDSGEDNGPFASFVSRIGRFVAADGGGVRFEPSGRFADIARQDGYKIEGVAVRPGTSGEVEVFAGTDDENYGATLRQVAPNR